jgi:endoglucanase
MSRARAPTRARPPLAGHLLPALAGSVALLLVAAAAVLALSVGGEEDPRGGSVEARAAVERFFDLYVAPDGRVVRHDQNGDTIGEGQAYAMLMAIATHDRERFETVWRWTREHLQRDDGLLSHRWHEGRVVDRDAAGDADLDAAHALVLAGARFDAPDLRRDGLELAAGILAEETVEAGGGRRVLVAGPWGRGEGAWINPSYLSPSGFDALGRASGDRRWRELRLGSAALTGALTARSPGLPPDWARLDPAGRPLPSAPPGGGAGPRFGFDAVRVPLRWASACDRRERRLAARPWDFLHGQAGGGIAPAYGLDGRRLASGTHPAALVAGAAAAFSAGDAGAGGRLLDRAAAEDDRSSTYYGAALVALGRVMLETSWLDGCASSESD